MAKVKNPYEEVFLNVLALLVVVGLPIAFWATLICGVVWLLAWALRTCGLLP
jgi:hypothetical protein